MTLNQIHKMCEGKCLRTRNLYLENLGLAKCITSEITKMLDIYPEVLVIEDDIEIGQNFINNMDNGLKVLKERTTIGVVSGFSPLTQINFFTLYKSVAIMCRDSVSYVDNSLVACAQDEPPAGRKGRLSAKC